MNLILGFAPFVVFFTLMRLAAPLGALAVAPIISAYSMFRVYRRGESIKVLDIGSLALFAAMTLYTAVANPGWSIGGVKLVVDAGLTLIAAVSMAIRQPFTLQYAKEQVPQQYWSSPRFYTANQLISGAWMASFALATLCDAAATYLPSVPLWLEVVLSVGGLAGAAWFTFWYRDRARRAVLVSP